MDTLWIIVCVEGDGNEFYWSTHDTREMARCRARDMRRVYPSQRFTVRKFVWVEETSS